MTDKGNITIVTVCDNHYIVMLAALLKSIEVNHRSDVPIDMHIVDDGITKRNFSKLQGSLASDTIRLKRIDIRSVIPRGLVLPKDNTSFPPNIYARLFLADWLDHGIKKILYLDVDIIVRHDIAALWQINMGDHTIAAVMDKVKDVSNSWAGIRNYRELNLKSDTKYFNSGLLLIDTDKWRSGGYTNKVLESIRDNLKFANFPDQYGLNVVFAGKWLELDPRWNCQSGSDTADPYVIHFTGRKPFYQSYEASQDFNNTHREEFYHYLRLTAWERFESIPEYRRLAKKLYIHIVKRLQKQA